jgi:chromosomal replication initiator protein
MGGTPLISDIKRAVALEYDVPLAVMSERDGVGARVKPSSHPRQVAMVLSARLTEHSIKRIGFFFGWRDHTTVLHAFRAVEKRRSSDPKLHAAMRRLTLDLLRGAACA